MSLEVIGLIVAIVAVIAILGLTATRGAVDLRRAAAVVAIMALAVVTTSVILARTPAGSGSATPTQSPTQSPSSPVTAPSPGRSPQAPAPSGSTVVLRYEVAVGDGTYPVFRVDVDGSVTAERMINFDRPSMAPVDRVEARNGLVHWRTIVGGGVGWSYIPERSGDFTIREVVQSSDGTTETREIDPAS